MKNEQMYRGAQAATIFSEERNSQTTAKNSQAVTSRWLPRNGYRLLNLRLAKRHLATCSTSTSRRLPTTCGFLSPTYC